MRYKLIGTQWGKANKERAHSRGGSGAEGQGARRGRSHLDPLPVLLFPFRQRRLTLHFFRVVNSVCF